MFAYATLVTNADYALGATALARSLKRVSSAWPLVVLAPPGTPGLDRLEAEGCRVREVAQPEVSDAFRRRHTREAQHARSPFDKGTKPAFHDPLDNFVKLRLWEMEEYERVVFIDADAIAVRNVDRLFAYPALSAAPNLYASLADMHRMNSGVFVARPDRRTYADMIQRLDAPQVFWRRTDQTFLEAYFPDWHGLPYVYNVLQYVYFNLPELWDWSRVKVVHYQYEKPWQADHPKRELLAPLIDLWHRVHDGRALPERIDPPTACASR